MGAFFTNYHIRHDDAQAVADVLTSVTSTRAYISPAKDGWVTVYEERSDEQDEEILRQLAMALSRQLSAAAIAFLVHDSDVFMYLLYDKGQLKDQYNSAPDYFGEVSEETLSRWRGDANALLAYCRSGTTVAQVEAILHPPDGPALMAEDTASELAQLLGIEPTRAVLGFRYFSEEAAEMLDDADAFLTVGGADPPAKPDAPAHSADAPAAQPDMFASAVLMLCSSWSANFSGLGSDAMARMQRQFDKQVPHFLELSRGEDRPSLDELKEARDQGPAALAQLVATRAPDQFVNVGIMAVNMTCEPLLAELLKLGLDPDAQGMNGWTVRSMTDRHGTDSPIYRLVEAAKPP